VLAAIHHNFPSRIEIRNDKAAVGTHIGFDVAELIESDFFFIVIHHTKNILIEAIPIDVESVTRVNCGA
jgi:hypothetical protein